MASVQLSRVRKQFGQVQVVHGVDLDIEDGELIVFVGPSGCGKSTLLRMIAGLEDVTAGEISIDGRDVTDLDPSQRGIAMVFQSYALYPHMSVEQNMGFGLKMGGATKAEVVRRVAAAAATLQLEPLLQRKPRELSGGQRQRVAIGRAIVREPQVFLFDEPLSNLDAELRVQMRLEISSLHNALGVTMIYVTHDQVEAMTLADRIVVLREGRIEQIGTPHALFNDPDNVFVAGFIGSPRINLLPADIGGEAGGLADVAVPAVGAQVRGVPVRAAGAAAGEISIGFRPEYVGFVEASDGPARVRHVETLGSISYIYGDAGGRPVTVAGRPDRLPLPGATGNLVIDAGRAFLFTAGGTRL